MHEPFGDELPHAGVDHREAGASSPPRVQRVRVFGPVPGSVGAGPVILRADVRERGRDLVEEITPGQLPAELLPARARQRGPCQLERRYAAEPQVGAQPGRPSAARASRPSPYRSSGPSSQALPVPARRSPPGASREQALVRHGQVARLDALGNGMAAGARQGCRQAVARQARQYGVKTR